MPENSNPAQTAQQKVSYDYTLIAKIIGALEMLVLVGIFSICLAGVCLRFKLKQKKSELERAQLTKDSNKSGVDGPYLITPNAKSLETLVRLDNCDKIILNQDGSSIIDLKTLNINVCENEFPPTYEEIVLRRIESKIETVRY